MNGADHWIIDGLTIRPDHDGSMVMDSSNNVFNRLLVEEGMTQLKDSSRFRLQRRAEQRVSKPIARGDQGGSGLYLRVCE